jgi:mannonate dehydratase
MAPASRPGATLRLRRALDHGVRVVIAHCASLGEDQDEDRGRTAPGIQLQPVLAPDG